MIRIHPPLVQEILRKNPPENAQIALEALVRVLQKLRAGDQRYRD